MRRLLLVAVVAALAAPRLAHADDDGPERPTSVDLSFTGGRAKLKAKFAFAVEGPGVSLGLHTFPVPSHSAVTGGFAIVDGKRHALRLEQAAVADKAFSAISVKPGGGKRRPWVFALEGTADLITLDVLAPRNANVELELTLDAPTCFHRDARYVELPESWRQKLPPARKKLSATAETLDEACGPGRDGDARWVGVASGELANKPPGERRMGAIAGRLVLDSTQFARVEIDLARELTTVPADLHTVLVVDHSRSLGGDELEAQRAIVAAYLRAAPASRVQVIGYTRTAHALLPSWATAMHAAPQVDRAIRALPPRNGSNVDEALREAASWLTGVHGTKRIVLFSDERLSRRLEVPDELRALVPADTLVHVVRPHAAGFGLERNLDEESPLPLLAKHTQGIAVVGSLVDQGDPDATMLLRPTSIDQLAVVAAGMERVELFSDVRDCNETLHEGESCTWWGEGSGAPGPITITGMLWNKPIKRVVHADPSLGRAIARALSAMQTLGPDLQPEVDRAAFAVNAFWSLFAQGAGSGGYEDVGGSGSFRSGTFGARSHDRGHGTPHVIHGRVPLDLGDQLKTAVAACSPGTARVALVVETTVEEIVDVTVTVTPYVASLERCVREGVWDVTLRLADAPPRATSRVVFPGTP